MSKNDKAIRQFQTKVDEKRQALGQRPRPAFRTNKIIDIPDDVKININLLRTQSLVVGAAAKLGTLILGYEKAIEMLGGGDMPDIYLGDYLLMDYVKDLQQQLSLVKWDEEAKQLQAMETKLKHMLSDEAKIEDELADISKELGM